MTFHILTLFPESLSSYLESSILKRAQAAGHIATRLYNIRDFTTDKHHKADDRPYGGGPGMVMYAEPIVRAVESITHSLKPKTYKVLLTSPGGVLFTNTEARKLATKVEHIILICGHYEGIDARAKKILRAQEISIGPFVLTGGELPALVIVDAVARQIEGVLGTAHSLEENRVSSHEVYTRPDLIEHKGKKYRVPKVLLSGNHREIEKWKSSSRKKS